MSSFIRPEAKDAIRHYGVPLALAIGGGALVWKGWAMMSSGAWIGFVLIAAGCFACLALIGAIERAVLGWRGRKGGPGVVSIEEGRIGYFGPDGGAIMALDSLVSVDIVTTSEGPFGEDLFWVLTDETRQMAMIPSGAQDAEKLLDTLGQLPGFNHRAVVSAMGSTADNRFEVWRKARQQVS